MYSRLVAINDEDGRECSDEFLHKRAQLLNQREGGTGGQDARDPFMVGEKANPHTHCARVWELGRAPMFPYVLLMCGVAGSRCQRRILS